MQIFQLNLSCVLNCRFATATGFSETQRSEQPANQLLEKRNWKAVAQFNVIPDCLPKTFEALICILRYCCIYLADFPKFPSQTTHRNRYCNSRTQDTKNPKPSERSKKPRARKTANLSGEGRRIRCPRAREGAVCRRQEGCTRGIGRTTRSAPSAGPRSRLSGRRLA